jgi:outer membrane protein assembly factor BamD (BamD/ComL family)
MIAGRLPLAGILCCITLLTACGSAKYEWSEAVTLNTIAAYQTFLSKYPNDAHAADAKSRIAQLQDEQAWSMAQADSSVEGYQKYLAAEPNGAHAQAARDEMASRERADAWQHAQNNETAASLEAFLQQYPTGREADRARDQLKVIAGYQAELGSSHNQQAADRERDELAKRLGNSFPQGLLLEPDTAHRDYRITSAPMSEAAATAACASVKQAGRACKVVPAST